MKIKTPHRLRITHYGSRITAHGFTLIEIIIVIVLLGIVSSLGVGLISTVFTGYSDTVTKNYLFNESKYILERISREIRLSIPNTARIHTNSATNDTLQFALFKNASYYEETPDKDTIKIIENNLTSDINTGDNISIYNTKANFFYNDSRLYNVGSISADNITFMKNIKKDSPYYRFYILDTPVTVFKSDDKIKRCYNYQIALSEDGISEGICNILGSHVDSLTFTYEEGNPWRNALVEIDITLKKGSTSINRKHRVNLRNVP